jgi:glucuronoarabinoxylan endo-1,4-beta-xylanase
MSINLKSKLKSALSVIISGAMLFSAASSIPTLETSAADTCVIDTSVTYQTIKGFGGMNHPEWTGSDLTAAQRQTAFGNGDNELGLSIVRIYVNNDKTQWYKALATAQDVVSRGGIVFATPWNPPDDMCETFTRTYTTWDGKTATQENQKRLRHDKYAEYAQYLNEFVHYMSDNGVDLYAISIQNEPDYGEDWTWMTSDECVDFLANYADVIDCPVMSPESFSYTKEYYTKILNNSAAYANTDIFGTHF